MFAKPENIWLISQSTWSLRYVLQHGSFAGVVCFELTHANLESSNSTRFQRFLRTVTNLKSLKKDSSSEEVQRRLCVISQHNRARTCQCKLWGGTSGYTRMNPTKPEVQVTLAALPASSQLIVLRSKKARQVLRAEPERRVFAKDKAPSKYRIIQLI